MSDQRLDILEKKLEEARVSKSLTGQQQKSSLKNDDGAMRFGLRAGTEFIVALTVPALLGYVLDGWLETRPIFMILLLLLGVGAGFTNIYRISQNLGSSVGYAQAKGELQKNDKTATSSQLSNLPKSKVNDDPK